MTNEALPPVFAVVRALTGLPDEFWFYRRPVYFSQGGVMWETELPVGASWGKVPLTPKSLDEAWRNLEALGLVPGHETVRGFACLNCAPQDSKAGCNYASPVPHSYAALVAWASIGAAQIVRIEEAVREVALAAGQDVDTPNPRPVVWLGAPVPWIGRLGSAEGESAQGGWRPHVMSYGKDSCEPYATVARHRVFPRYGSRGPIELCYPGA
jgi:hypothetical protein